MEEDNSDLSKPNQEDNPEQLEDPEPQNCDNINFVDQETSNQTQTFFQNQNNTMNSETTNPESPNPNTQETIPEPTDEVSQDEEISENPSDPVNQSNLINQANVTDQQARASSIINTNTEQIAPTVDSFVDYIMQEQASLVSYLNESENQMMLDEGFIQSIAAIANKNNDDFYKYNFDDEVLEQRMKNWVEEENTKISLMLKEALKFYNEQLFEGHLKKLQRMMKIFHCKKKEIYIVKEVKEKSENDDGLFNTANMDDGNGLADKFQVHFPTAGTTGRVDEMLNYMIVTERDSVQLSLDNNINKRLHSLKRGDSLMRMHMGKGDSNMVVYIRAVDESVIKERKKCILDRLSPIMFQNFVMTYFSADELFKLRGVCRSWRVMITNIWHNIFQREMFHQLLATDLFKEVISFF